MAARFYKFYDGRWGISGYNLVEGDLVEVERRSGVIVRVRVGPRVWTGDNGYCIHEFFTKKARSPRSP